MTEDEFTLIQRHATDRGMTPSTFLAVVGRADPAPAGSGLTASERYVVNAELSALQAQMRGAARNLNQLAAMAHSRGEIPPAIVPVLARVHAALERTEQFLARLTRLAP